jgi:hypothetical protein
VELTVPTVEGKHSRRCLPRLAALGSDSSRLRQPQYSGPASFWQLWFRLPCGLNGRPLLEGFGRGTLRRRAAPKRWIANTEFHVPSQPTSYLSLVNLRQNPVTSTTTPANDCQPETLGAGATPQLSRPLYLLTLLTASSITSKTSFGLESIAT